MPTPPWYLPYCCNLVSTPLHSMAGDLTYPRDPAHPPVPQSLKDTFLVLFAPYPHVPLLGVHDILYCQRPQSCSEVKPCSSLATQLHATVAFILPSSFSILLRTSLHPQSQPSIKRIASLRRHTVYIKRSRTMTGGLIINTRPTSV